MKGDQKEQLIGRIYQAALDGGRWADCLIELTRATGASQANLSIMHPNNAVTLVTPFWDEGCRRDFIAHYRNQFSLFHRAAHLPPGRTFTYGDLTDLDWFRSTALFNEWWLPQGVGGGSIGAKLVGDGSVTAFLTVHARRGEQGFERTEASDFEALVPHLIRSVQIQRKLQLAEIRSSSRLEHALADVAIFDCNSQLLDASAQALRRLITLGLLAPDARLGRLVSRDGRIEKMISEAAQRNQGGQVDLPQSSGGPARVNHHPLLRF